MKVLSTILVLSIIMCAYTSNAIYSIKHNMKNNLKNSKGKIAEALTKETAKLSYTETFISQPRPEKRSSNYPSYGSADIRSQP